MKRYVITGGPGVGKTTTINKLAELGFPTIREVARDIIEEQQACNGTILPTKDCEAFQRECIKRQEKYENEFDGDMAFLDRGSGDHLAYCRYNRIQFPGNIEGLKGRYSSVFLLERLPNYQRDGARWENDHIAGTIHDLIKSTYKELGYELIEVPVGPPEWRANYVLERIKK